VPDFIDNTISSPLSNTRKRNLDQSGGVTESTHMRNVRVYPGQHEQ
jgi:hypothetical protein